jgi:DNA-directed RNA polymerase III subunit RPC1
VSSPDRVASQSVVDVSCPLLFDQATLLPAEHGPLDLRLGRAKEDGACATCGLGVMECSGHFGHISLELPLFHAGYFKQVMLVLSVVCKRCARLLIDDKTHWRLTKLANGVGPSDSLRRQLLARSVVETCKKTKDSVCPHCFHVNGKVKRARFVKKEKNVSVLF